MTYNKKIFIGFVSLFLLLIFGIFSSFFAEEKITLTTYYPAPYGIYKELRSNQMAVGSTYRNNSLSDGNLIVSGNVGIGTPSPKARLHVTSNAGILNLEGINHAYIQWYPDGYTAGRKGWIGWGSSTNNNFTIANEISGANIVLSPNNGNVGIGIANPEYKLHISGGDVKVVATDGNGANIHAVDNAGKAVDFAAQDGNGYIKTEATGMNLILGAGNWGWDGGSYNRQLVLKDGGNVGIGTESPEAKLEVEGGDIKLADKSGETPFIIKSYSNADSLWLMSSTPELVLADDINWDRAISIYYSAGNTGLGNGILTIGQIDKNDSNYTHGVTRFYTKGEERMRIKNDGNVGIGTTDPTKKLMVNGGFTSARTYRLYSLTASNTNTAQNLNLGNWDICFLSQYRIHDMLNTPNDECAAGCRVYSKGIPGTNTSFGAGSTPSWELVADVDQGEEWLDVNCEAICLNFQ